MSVAPPPSEPRVAHYLFAHRAVPRAFLRNPPAILGILGSEQAMEFLGGMWDVLGKELEASDRVQRDGLSVACYQLEHDVFAAVVTMPPPQRSFEAFYVACCARLEGDDAFSRAFTLDLAGPPGAEPLTGILEWDDEGNHDLVVAEPVAVDVSSFTDAIERILAKEAKG